MSRTALSWLWIVWMVVSACNSSETYDVPSRRFELLTAKHTQIDFINQLDYTEELNTYTYKNFYNGGGVGVGDFDNDGLVDLFFAGNLVSNKLYRNKGNFIFEDVTSRSPIGAEVSWTTGVCIVDVNGDNRLDIYLCKSGPPGGPRRRNELFINHGNFNFTDSAAAYGLDFEGLSTHAAFFDFDRDGDLDCYLLNNSFRSVGGYDLRVGQRNIADPKGGNKLLRNDDGKFVDITTAAGIYSSEIGFGLGVSIADINADGWPDIYVSNDFFEKDYLYINMGDGSFHEDLEGYIQEISMGSMGADIADINNDGRPEIFVTEMLPEHDARLKTTTQFENWDKYQMNVKSGYYRQFSRNVLQLNNGNNTFSEIGRYAGVAATDWSWGALIFDMDNDGFKDIFVANGIFKELLNQDYVNYTSNPELLKQISQRKKGMIRQLIDSIPSTPLVNYGFQNNGNLTFTNRSSDWGLDKPGFSNGSAYADLDNDGDLDLVLNNINSTASVYKNRSNEIDSANHYVAVVLQGDRKNTAALGAKVLVKTSGKTFYLEQSPMRGFMSTVDNKITMGVGNVDLIDTLIVTWPDGGHQLLTELGTDTTILLKEKEAIKSFDRDVAHAAVTFKTASVKGVNFTHIENDYNDFNQDRLLFTMASNEGPCLCKGDANGDGLDDFYVGGAKDHAGGLFIQQGYGGFIRSTEKVFNESKSSEDTDCAFFDANGDGRQDLYIASGGSEFSRSSVALLNRLYFSIGNNKFKKSEQPLPVATQFETVSTVRPADFDNDGDIDLFVGARMIPGSYGIPANGYLLQNDGHGKFTDITKTTSPALAKLGMITDARWADITNDGKIDLVIVGEYMGVRIFVNHDGKFEDMSDQSGLTGTEGWYHSLEVADLNKDGLTDLVVGNYGTNSRFKGSAHEPVVMYVNDFDKNGTLEHVTCVYDEGVSYPLVLRQDLLAQLPSLKKNFLHFRDYKNKRINDIFTSQQLQDTIALYARTFESTVWINKGNGKFTGRALPAEAQLFPVFAVLVEDFTGDGNLDLLLGGNQHSAKPETGIYAAGYGLLLAGDSSGNFKTVVNRNSGLEITGDIRALGDIRIGKQQYVLVARNNDTLEILGY